MDNGSSYYKHVCVFEFITNRVQMYFILLFWKNIEKRKHVMIFCKLIFQKQTGGLWKVSLNKYSPFPIYFPNFLKKSMYKKPRNFFCFSIFFHNKNTKCICIRFVIDFKHTHMFFRRIIILHRMLEKNFFSGNLV